MDVVPVISLGAAAFWIALAAVLIAGGWHKVRREQIKQETLLKLIEKTGRLDEELVKTMFPPPPPPSPWPPPWHRPDPLEGQRSLRVGGVVVMGVAAGLAVLGLVLRILGTGQQQDEWGIAFLGLAGLVAGLAGGARIRFVMARLAYRVRRRRGRCARGARDEVGASLVRRRGAPPAGVVRRRGHTIVRHG